MFFLLCNKSSKEVETNTSKRSILSKNILKLCITLLTPVERPMKQLLLLKKIMMVKLPNLKIPEYVKDKYTFSLNYYPPKFPSLPTSIMALDLSPPVPQLFICREDLKVLKNKSLTSTKRVTSTRNDIYSFKGHLHVE